MLDYKDIKNKYGTIIFLVILGVFVLIVAGHNFERYHVASDYPLHVFTNCDSTKNSCFGADPDIGDPTFQSGTYEKVEMIASGAPHCLDEHTCTDFTCDGIADCQITYCSEETIEDGESCTTNQNH